MEKAINDRFPTERGDDFQRAEEFTPVEPEEKPIVTDAIPSEEYVAETTVQEASVPVFDDFQAQNESTDDDNFDVNIVSDIGDRDVITYQKKKKTFASLKFGDDYDINNDDGDADSDINN